MLTAPTTSWARLPHVLGWIWLLLLQFCASNQSLSPNEDAINKPWRPIPAQRISVTATKWLRWILFPVCLVQSVAYGVVLPALAVNASILLYDTMKLDVHWITRNVCNGLAYVGFTFGAAHIACGQLTLPYQLHASMC